RCRASRRPPTSAAIRWRARSRALPKSPDLAASRAYVDALKMLARRELSEQQVGHRLARKAHDPRDIDDAVERLRSERALDDARVAEAIARTEVAVRKRGKLRVQMQI